jgi:PPOX class probable F420-dependent enzyme
VSVDSAQARDRFAASVVARLATTGPGGRPHLVPVTFALLDDATIVSAVDHKPKRTTALRRLANIAANPEVSLLVDHYEDDWSELWWARADGHARVLDDFPAAAQALVARYPQYRERRPSGPFIVVEVERFSGWSPTYSGAQEGTREA